MRTAIHMLGFTTTRRLVQLAFLILVLVGVYIVGANCERWCPFGGVEALYTYATEGNMLCSLGTANFFILGGVLVMTLLVRRAFCGYMCPIGTISEWLRVVGQRLRIPTITVPYRMDRVLALLKYVLLAVILWLTWRAGELIFRGFDPCYALISRHGMDITFWAYVVSGVIVVASLMMMLPFCRWFCPLAAVLNPFSRFGLTRIKRDEHACSNCGLCTKSCPVAIPVDEVKQVTAARCISCMNCVDVCPDKKSQSLTWGPPRQIGRRWPQAVLIAILLLCTSGAVTASYMFPFPSFVKERGELPEVVATVKMRVTSLHCRGNANLMYYFLDRNDNRKIAGYLKLEAWPDPKVADVRVTYDPSLTSEKAIKRAITHSYYDDDVLKGWRHSPFQIEGYHPADDEEELDLDSIKIDDVKLDDLESDDLLPLF